MSSNKKNIFEVKSICITGVQNSKGEMIKTNIPWGFVRIRDDKWFKVDGEGKETPLHNDD